MNDDLPFDPHLRSLEARLAATALPLPPDRQQELLYQCAFAAGQRSGHAKLRRWQAGAIVCAALFAATIGLSFSNRSTSGPDIVQAPERTIWKPWQPFLGNEDLPSTHETTSVQLDAWQIPDRFPSEQDSSVENEVPDHSFTVGSLTRKILEP